MLWCDTTCYLLLKMETLCWTVCSHVFAKYPGCPEQCFLFSRNIDEVTPKFMYFYNKTIFSWSKHPKNTFFFGWKQKHWSGAKHAPQQRAESVGMAAEIAPGAQQLSSTAETGPAAQTASTALANSSPLRSLPLVSSHNVNATHTSTPARNKQWCRFSRNTA